MLAQAEAVCRLCSADPNRGALLVLPLPREGNMGFEA